MARTSITIVLEIQADDSPVGSARLSDGTERRFHGWLGFAEAIDALAGMPARRGARSSTAPHRAEPKQQRELEHEPR